jgi:hypothetical protein
MGLAMRVDVVGIPPAAPQQPKILFPHNRFADTHHAHAE